MDDVQLTITTPFIKLDSFLKLSGICATGGEAKLRIAAGEIFVEGEVCLQRGKKLYPGTTVTADSKQYCVHSVSA